MRSALYAELKRRACPASNGTCPIHSGRVPSDVLSQHSGERGMCWLSMSDLTWATYVALAALDRAGFDIVDRRTRAAIPFVPCECGCGGRL